MKKTAAIIATGSEVKKGLIQDTFTPVVKEKLAAYGIETRLRRLLRRRRGQRGGRHCGSPENRRGPDPLHRRHERGPGRQHPRRYPSRAAHGSSPTAPRCCPAPCSCWAILRTAPPSCGLPGCVMYAGATIFDLALPRIAAGVELTRSGLRRDGRGRAVPWLQALSLAQLPLRKIKARAPKRAPAFQNRSS